MKHLLILKSVILCLCAQDFGWTVNDYPNPRANGYKECKMRSVSSVCDPDEILTESERYRLNNDLQRLGSRTEISQGTFCQKKGVDAVLAVMHKGSQALAEQLNRKWNTDGQCKKSVIFLLSADDRKLYYTGEEHSGISETDFTGIIATHEDTLKEGLYLASIAGVLKELGRKKEEENQAKHPVKPRPGPTGAAVLPSATALILSALLAVA